MEYSDYLDQADLLRSLSEEEIESCLDTGSFKISAYGKNGIVHFVGEACVKLDVILSGSVVVERIDEAGNLMTVAEFIANDILGGNLLFPKIRIIHDHYARQRPLFWRSNGERCFSCSPTPQVFCGAT
jgi:hypothetical protein